MTSFVGHRGFKVGYAFFLIYVDIVATEGEFLDFRAIANHKPLQIERSFQPGPV
jgi:hypothetical protein